MSPSHFREFSAFSSRVHPTEESNDPVLGSLRFCYCFLPLSWYTIGVFFKIGQFSIYGKKSVLRMCLPSMMNLSSVIGNAWQPEYTCSLPSACTDVMYSLNIQPSLEVTPHNYHLCLTVSSCCSLEEGLLGSYSAFRHLSFFSPLNNFASVDNCMLLKVYGLIIRYGVILNIHKTPQNIG